jgi:hypothetical protein
METIVTVTFLILLVLTAILLAIGQSRDWGVAPVGLLGLGFIIPFIMMLFGIL